MAKQYAPGAASDRHARGFSDDDIVYGVSRTSVDGATLTVGHLREAEWLVEAIARHEKSELKP